MLILGPLISHPGSSRGLEKALDFARKLAAQKPVWGSGHVAIVVVLSRSTPWGRVTRHDYQNATRIRRTASVPQNHRATSCRLNEFEGVLNTLKTPTRILWLEFSLSEGSDLC
jgi:hypothetical protein